MFFSVVHQATNLGLEGNEQKTRYMVITRKEFKSNQSAKMGAYTFEIVKEFKYLDTLLTQKNELR